jgi:hypothetical protein
VRLAEVEGIASGRVVLRASSMSVWAEWEPVAQGLVGSAQGTGGPVVLELRGRAVGWIYKLVDRPSIVVRGRGVVVGPDVHRFVCLCVSHCPELARRYHADPDRDTFVVRDTGQTIRDTTELMVHAMSTADIDMLEELRTTPERRFRGAVDAWDGFDGARCNKKMGAG